VLFADIMAFTTISEHKDPAEVVDMLNHFFTQMVDLVFEHQGTLDKFLGDGLMVFFGAPLEVPRAASQAVACAIAMQQRLHALKQEGATPIQGLRVGVNTGEAIIGNIGSAKRMDFTIVGDVVNVAARLLEAGPSVVLRGRQQATVSHLVEFPLTP
jgi:class 3 adenylate cyclase